MQEGDGSVFTGKELASAEGFCNAAWLIQRWGKRVGVWARRHE
jgi:hypothetical protein